MGILDLGGRLANSSARASLNAIIEAAQAAEHIGFKRFWIAEHHTPYIAEAAPEVMVALVASKTSKIKVGSGGVLLPYYSPIKVAETFRLLSTMFPGRIELGFGRGPGLTDDKLANELVWGNRSMLEPEDHTRKAHRLVTFLRGGFPPGHELADVHAYPIPERTLPIWFLCGGARSMRLAAELGVGMSYGYHITNDESVNADTIAKEYSGNYATPQDAAKPATSFAVTAYCCKNGDEARRDNGRMGLQNNMMNQVVGDPEECATRIRELAQRFAIDDVLVSCTIMQRSKRVRSFELIAEACEKA